MADAILKRLSAETFELDSMFSTYLFDLKILFILTAKCDDIRQAKVFQGIKFRINIFFSGKS